MDPHPAPADRSDAPAPEAVRPVSVWRAPGMPPLIATVALAFAGYSVLLPVAPLWAVSGGADAAGAGFVTGVFMLATVLAQGFVPAALRRFGWGPVLVVGLVLLGAPALGYLLSAELGPVLAWSAVRGMGFAVITVAGSAAVAELVEPARRGRAIGAFGLAIAGPQVIVLPLGPWLVEQFGAPVVLACGAVPVLGIAPALVLAARIRARPPHPPAEHLEHGHVFARFRGLVPPVVLLLGATLAGGAIITFLPQMLDDALLVTVGLVLLTATAALTRWLVGGLADRLGPSRLTWPLVIVAVVGLTIVAAAVAPGLLTQGVAGAAVPVGAVLIGIAYGGLQNLTLVQSFSAVAPRDAVVASAAWNVGFDAGTGLGAVVTGAIAAATGFGWALAAAAAAAITLCTLPFAFVRARRRGSAEA
ncbi:MFS transporter [Agromyces sp. LHK192]|uniref:MFS transporter n=1 Tax=Agromyces sp. LHK192 TaxID=2498704 RepID=UPI000FD91BBA|nr:MFS transporter [Agromyces sp. LHK192]